MTDKFISIALPVLLMTLYLLQSMSITSPAMAGLLKINHDKILVDSPIEITGGRAKALTFA